MSLSNSTLKGRCWVARISRLLKNIGLFCNRALQKRPHSAKETYNLEYPLWVCQTPLSKAYLNQHDRPIFIQNNKLSFVWNTPVFCIVLTKETWILYFSYEHVHFVTWLGGIVRMSQLWYFEREGKKERETERPKERERERARAREGESKSKSERERKRARERERDRERTGEGERQRDNVRESERKWKQ